jgi:hypothetical protein
MPFAGLRPNNPVHHWLARGLAEPIFEPLACSAPGKLATVAALFTLRALSIHLRLLF